LTAGSILDRVALVGAEYTGDVAGGAITGEWKQLGMTNPLTLKRD
jgi:hypothetical protein